MPHHLHSLLSACCFLALCSPFTPAEEIALQSGNAPAQPDAPQKKFRILVLTQSMGYKHAVVTRPAQPPGALSVVETALAEIGAKSGVYDAECVQDASVITPEKLKDLDALVFFTSGDLPIKPATFTAVQNWLRGGKAFIGIHSATDTFKEFRPYYETLGATYLRHPWNHGGIVSNLEPSHPAVSMFPASFEWGDELCEHRFFDPRKVRVLLALNISKSTPKATRMVPLCWVREYGKGRVFYTNFGNGENVWSNPAFRAHLLGGIRWAIKLDDGSAEPNPEIAAREDTRARAAALDSEKSWLTKAAKSSATDPAAVIAAADKCAANDKAAFTKLYEAIQKARADEAKHEAALKPNQRPSDADVKAVLTHRKEIVDSLLSVKNN